MARITPEQIEQINEVYAECGVKSRTAKIVGVSVASVNKYLIDGYVPKAQREQIIFEVKSELNCESFLARLAKAEDKFQEFFNAFELSEEEKTALAALQKEAF